jgi:hypothetical protein
MYHVSSDNPKLMCREKENVKFNQSITQVVRIKFRLAKCAKVLSERGREKSNIKIDTTRNRM